MGRNIVPYSGHQGTKREQVEQMFDNIAPRYDLLNRLLSMNIDVAWRKKVRRAVALTKPTTILDLATGTGDLAIELARHLPAAKVTGGDIAEKMLEIGREKVRKKGLESQIDLVTADAQHLPFADAAFDAVTVAFGVRNFENLRAGLQEMLRVLKPGGHAFILEFSTPKNPIFRFFNHIYCNTMLPVVGRMLSKDRSAYTYLPKSAAAFPSGERFAAIMEEAGFSKISHKPFTFGICTLYIGRRP